jgi:hypothetical protein
MNKNKKNLFFISIIKTLIKNGENISITVCKRNKENYKIHINNQKKVLDLQLQRNNCHRMIKKKKNIKTFSIQNKKSPKKKRIR